MCYPCGIGQSKDQKKTLSFKPLTENVTEYGTRHNSSDIQIQRNMYHICVSASNNHPSNCTNLKLHQSMSNKKKLTAWASMYSINSQWTQTVISPIFFSLLQYMVVSHCQDISGFLTFLSTNMGQLHGLNTLKPTLHGITKPTSPFFAFFPNSKC